jgi:FtsH-binding integral membrane protein
LAEVELMNYPHLVFILSTVGLSLSSWCGAALRKRRGFKEDLREDYGVVQTATLTMLALIIGFTFSMAVNRYDQRKDREAVEANTIGTEYLRAGLLPADAGRIRSLIVNYLDQRIVFYRTRDQQQLAQADARTAQLQNDMWSAMQAAAAAQPTPITGLAVAGMNEVIDAQGYALAAWQNRIPSGAWILLAVIAIGATFLVGFGSRRPEMEPRLLLVMPLILSISFFLIADIDSPRGGLIRVRATNLEGLAVSLHAVEAKP